MKKFIYVIVVLFAVVVVSSCAKDTEPTNTYEVLGNEKKVINNQIQSVDPTKIKRPGSGADSTNTAG